MQEVGSEQKKNIWIGKNYITFNKNHNWIWRHTRKISDNGNKYTHMKEAQNMISCFQLILKVKVKFITDSRENLQAAPFHDKDAHNFFVCKNFFKW